MEKYLCIHGHFYQPPRENPWLESIEIQDSAYPYHDWNEKITSECYAPNSAARNLNEEGRILNIVSNYARISFNFGPTLLSWMEKNAPETYQAVLDADKQSIEWRSGHGNAIAQVYNHIIMPLANARDKRTQVLWGIRDFEYRFQRSPEGMWLSETAADIETLDILAECGIQFTILAPHQASRIKRIGTGKWKDVSGARVDPTRAYLCRLPSGRTINLFFYDGPISRTVAFEELLKKGEDFANRLFSGFSYTRDWPQIIHIATDGETYGHHQRFGDMALAYALNYLESRGMARITNYAEYLALHPPTHEVQIIENSSWSCIHGIERWRSNCGCNSGGHPGWNQEWRTPLRNALDWLRDRVSVMYEKMSSDYLRDPWKARDDYGGVILNRSGETVQEFLGKYAVKNLTGEERTKVLKLLEVQRHALLMYTSCGWFFDELSGLETVQVLRYAGRVIQLTEDISTDSLGDSFKARLALAKSNLPEHENGAVIYENHVQTAMIDLKRVAAHYAVNSLFEDYVDETGIYSYTIRKEDYRKISAGPTNLAVGRISVSSNITGKSEWISFCILHFGGHALNGGVRTFLGDKPYNAMKGEIITTFEKGAFADIVRLMDNHFGMHNYSLSNLFRDQQRIVLDFLIAKTLESLEDTYRRLYENNRILMGFLKETGMPIKQVFLSAAEFTLNAGFRKAILDEVLDVHTIQNIFHEMKRWDVPYDTVDIEFSVRRSLEKKMETLCANPFDLDALLDIQQRIEVLKSLPVEINYWQVQNTFYKIAQTASQELSLKADAQTDDAKRWVNAFRYLGEMLFFNVGSVLPHS